MVSLLCCAAWLPQSRVEEAIAAAEEGRGALVPLFAAAAVDMQVTNPPWKQTHPGALAAPVPLLADAAVDMQETSPHMQVHTCR